MITPDVIYLFEFDDDVVWADTDESEDLSGTNYVKIDGQAMKQIKSQAIEEAVEYVDSQKTMLHETRGLLEEFAEKLRSGEL